MEYEKLEGRRQFEEADDCILKVITVNEAYLGKLPYAAQTYAGGSDRVISMPWLRLPNRGTLYTGAMGLPRELSVVRLDGEKYLAQSLPREWREKCVPADERAAGFCEVCVQKNVQYQVVGTHAYEYKHLEYHEVLEQLLLQHPDTDGIFASSDLIAAQLLQWNCLCAQGRDRWSRAAPHFRCRW